MTGGHDNLQRIERLTPLREVLSRITASVAPVAPVEMPLVNALGRVIAEDVTLTTAVPAEAIALTDGYAVQSEATAGASAYAPMLLAHALPIDAGQRLPAGTDAVIADDSVMEDDAGVHALTEAMPGQGVLPMGGDVRTGAPVQVAGTQLRLVDLAVLAAAGVGSVAVRVPRVCVAAIRTDPILRQIVTLIEHLVRLRGGEVLAPGGDADVMAMLARRDAHITILVGGSGAGRDDRSVQLLARAGRLDVHGIAIGPGQTSAIGAVDAVPVLVLPGRMDAALTAWLMIGVPLMRGLTGSIEERPRIVATLARKVTSTVGLLELVPVRLQGEKATPLASGYLPLHVLSAANAYIVVPAESEGYPEGATVNARLLP